MVIVHPRAHKQNEGQNKTRANKFTGTNARALLRSCAHRWVARVCRVRRPRRPAKMRAHTAAISEQPFRPSVAANSAVDVPRYQPHGPQRADQTATQKPPRGHNLNRPSRPLRSNPYAPTRTTRCGPHGQQRETAAALLATRATKCGPNGHSKTTARTHPQSAIRAPRSSPYAATRPPAAAPMSNSAKQQPHGLRRADQTATKKPPRGHERTHSPLAIRIAPQSSRGQIARPPLART